MHCCVPMLCTICCWCCLSCLAPAVLRPHMYLWHIHLMLLLLVTLAMTVVAQFFPQLLIVPTVNVVMGQRLVCMSGPAGTACLHCHEHMWHDGMCYPWSQATVLHSRIALHIQCMLTLTQAAALLASGHLSCLPEQQQQVVQWPMTHRQDNATITTVYAKCFLRRLRMMVLRNIPHMRVCMRDGSGVTSRPTITTPRSSSLCHFRQSYW